MPSDAPMADPTLAVVPWPTPKALARDYPHLPVALLREDAGHPACLALILPVTRVDGCLSAHVATPDLSALIAVPALIPAVDIVRRFDGLPHPKDLEFWRAHYARRPRPASLTEEV